MILINKQQALTPHVTSSYPQHVESSDSFDTVTKGFVSLDIKILKKRIGLKSFFIFFIYIFLIIILLFIKIYILISSYLSIENHYLLI